MLGTSRDWVSCLSQTHAEGIGAGWLRPGRAGLGPRGHGAIPGCAQRAGPPGLRMGEIHPPMWNPGPSQVAGLSTGWSTISQLEGASGNLPRAPIKGQQWDAHSSRKMLFRHQPGRACSLSPHPAALVAPCRAPGAPEGQDELIVLGAQPELLREQTRQPQGRAQQCGAVPGCHRAVAWGSEPQG